MYIIHEISTSTVNYVWWILPYIYSTYTYMHINLKTELQRIGSRQFIQLIQYAIWPYCWPLRVLEVIFQPSRTIYDYFDPIYPP
jgi:hypothetical protein